MAASTRATRVLLGILACAGLAGGAFAMRAREKADVLARYAGAACLPRNVRLNDAGSMGWDHRVLPGDQGEALISMRNVGKGQKVTARYDDELVVVADAGDLSSVEELRLAPEVRRLYVGMAGGLEATDGWLVEYDLIRRRARRFAVDPAAWPPSCVGGQ